MSGKMPVDSRFPARTTGKNLDDKPKGLGLRAARAGSHEHETRSFEPAAESRDLELVALDRNPCSLRHQSCDA